MSKFLLPTPSKTALTMVPLGGCGQFGANVTLYGFDGKWLMVDCGMAFADERLPGVDVLLPDVSSIVQQAEKLCGLVITHAHEDHIGAVAWHWPQLKCPIYAAPFTAGVLEKKFEEHTFLNGRPAMRLVESDKAFEIGPFKVRFLPVAHSIPETRMLVIETPVGRVVHTGDWNLDPSPICGELTPESALRALGDEGVLAYVGDSTNAQVRGKDLTEADVEQGLYEVFKKCPRKIAVTMFASNIGRLVSTHRVATKLGRKVVLVGRSLHTMVDVARRTGFVPADMQFLDDRDIERLKDDQLVLVVTGSQGEGRAALSRIARATHPSVKLKHGDTVIFSSRAIPGNETAINEIKNLLLAQDVKIITDHDAPIHVSGHPARAEITSMLSWLKPKAVLPVHGERQQQSAHAELAKTLHVEHVYIPENGTIIEIAPSGALTPTRHIPVTMQAIEMGRVQAADAMTILERRKMSFNGAVFVSLVLAEGKGSVVDVQVSALGVLNETLPEDEQVLADMEDYVAELVEKADAKLKQDVDALIETVRGKARRFVADIYGVKPLVSVHISYV